MNNQSLATLLYVVVLFALLYFLLIRPQQVRQKKHQQMIRSLKVNDQIVTIGGIYGTIVKVKEDTFVVRVADNVRIEILKSAVGQVRQQEAEDKD
ncbi:MAG: preprotein translocase subunit YajC [Armatimonadetes bacterium]|nr:preprotein translocase subunit YajC [Armatimonadota bacterium]